MTTSQPIAVSNRRAGVLAVLVGGACLFLAALDFSINVSLPTFRESLSETLVSVQWIIILYHGARSGMGFVAGGIADRFGLKRLLLFGILAYTLSVAAISLQSSLLPIAALRIPQGIGVAILFTLGPALVARAFGPSRRGAALGVTIGAMGAGQLTGTLGGGLLTQNIGWEAIFWARVPIGLAILLLGALVLRGTHVEPSADAAKTRFDWPGGGVLFVLLFTMVLALSFARLDGWLATRPALLYIATAALLLAFLWREKRTIAPVFPVALLKVREFRAGAASNILNTGATFVIWFLFPFYVSDVMGRGPVALGALLATMAAATFAGSSASGWVADKFGDRRTTFSGAMLSAAGLVVVGQLGASPPVVAVAGSVALVGFGFGVHQAAVYALTMRGTPARHAGAASATLAVTQTLGTVSSIALMTSLLTWRQAVATDGGRSDTFLVAYAEVYMAAACLSLLSGFAVVLIKAGRKDTVPGYPAQPVKPSIRT